MAAHNSSPIALQGAMSDDTFEGFLHRADELNLYATVQLTGGDQDGYFMLASGRIVLEAADDVIARRIAQHKIVDLFRKNLGGTGSFQCAPITGIPLIDAHLTVATIEVMRASTQVTNYDRLAELKRHRPALLDPPPAQSPKSDVSPATPGRPIVTAPAVVAPPTGVPSTLPDLNKPAPEAPPTRAQLAASATVSQNAVGSIGPDRARQIRERLRDSRNGPGEQLSESAQAKPADQKKPDDVVAAVIADSTGPTTGRSEALKGLIRRLAS